MSERPPLPGDPLQLRIEKPIYGGAGLARHDGKAIFTPFTLPGECVTASVTYSKANFAEASLDSILKASADRTTAPCPYFGTCGGCHYQHATYSLQLNMKTAILKESLTRAGLITLPEILAHAGDPFHYRNRVRLQIDPLTSAMGYRERNSHRLIPVEQCPIAAPALEQALAAFTEVCRVQQCGSTFKQAEWSINHDGSELLLAFTAHPSTTAQQATSRLAEVCAALQPNLPALLGAAVFAPLPEALASRGAFRDSPKHRSAASSARKASPTARDPSLDDAAAAEPGATLALWGAPRMTYRAAGNDYRVSLGAFFQVNRTLIDTLVHLATEGRSGALAWDLYAGVGLFSRVLTGRFDQVTAVEGSPVSAEDLRLNLAAPHRAVRATTLDFLRREAAWARPSAPASRRPGRPTPPDFVLVDPPRAGLGEEVTRLLAQIGPPEITYVSCDPATLSRDLRALVDSGYKLQQLHLIDLFPQTFHLEAVAKLSRP